MKWWDGPGSASSHAVSEEQACVQLLYQHDVSSDDAIVCVILWWSPLQPQGVGTGGIASNYGGTGGGSWRESMRERINFDKTKEVTNTGYKEGKSWPNLLVFN